MVWHREAAAAGQQSSESSRPPAGREPLIVNLRLCTSTPLAEMERFYHELLGLPVRADRDGGLTILAGETPITFVKADLKEGPPWYHVAFNIPENKLLAARAWQHGRTPLLQVRVEVRPDAATEADLADVADFRHWNAHSVFFWDPAGNLLEYIARHDLKNAAPGSFSSKDILYGSEIGFVVADVPAIAERVKEELGLGTYRGANDGFQAIGDEYGLLLILSRGRRPWAVFNPLSRAFDVYPTHATIRGSRKTIYSVPEHPYEIGVRTG
jgi:catechol-2,3-dioxygenase